MINLCYGKGLLTLKNKRWKEACKTLAACYTFIKDGASLYYMYPHRNLNQPKRLTAYACRFFSKIKMEGLGEERV